MATCTTKISSGLDPSCDALDKIGGVDKTLYVGNLDEMTFGPLNGAGYIDDIILAASPAAFLYKFIGKTKKNNATATLEVGANTNTWKQAVIAKLYYYFPEDRAAIEALCSADDLVVIIQTESGLFEVYGWTKGVRCEAAVAANGILIQDDTSMTVTISGEEASLPKVLQLGAAIPGEDDYLTQNIDALDALTA